MGKAGVGVGVAVAAGDAHYYMVEDFDFQKLTGADEVAGDFDVRFTGGGFSARVIVLCEARSYV